MQKSIRQLGCQKFCLVNLYAMHQWRCYLESLELAHLLVDSLYEKKAQNITLLDLTEQASFADYFLICSADNDRLLRALSETITEDAKQQGKVIAGGREGMAENGWVLIDYGDLIVHLFSPEKREYYKLEELWSDARVVLHMQ